MGGEGFRVNDFEHLDEAKQEGLDQRRERSGWGLVREDHAMLLTDVRIVYDDDTPPEMRRLFAEASAVLHHIAEKAVMDQLKHDGLSPVERLDMVTGLDGNGKQVVVRASGWLPFEE